VTLMTRSTRLSLVARPAWRRLPPLASGIAVDRPLRCVVSSSTATIDIATMPK